jgi:RNA polymerase sigma-70 factor, ECF subfamily
VTNVVIDQPSSGHLHRWPSRIRDTGNRDLSAELALAYTEHRAGLHRYFLSRTRDIDRAEDLTQEVFADVASYLVRTKRACPMARLLYVVARRRLADEIRSAKPGQHCRSLAWQGSQSSQAESSAASAFSRALTNAVLGLSARERRIFVMRFLEGRTFPEIAAVLNSSEAACKVACGRARRAVGTRLRQAGIVVE